MTYAVIMRKGNQEIIRFEYKTFGQASNFVRDAYEGIDLIENNDVYFDIIIVK